MKNTSNWPTYLEQLGRDVRDIDIARQIKSSPSTVGRWRNGTSIPAPSQAVDVARAFGLHPLSALVACGYLTWGEVDLLSKDLESSSLLQLENYSSIDLLAELTRREQGRVL